MARAWRKSRRIGFAALLLIGALPGTGCCILSFWDRGGNRAYNVDLGKIGSGEQAISSPNDGKPWQGDKVEKNFGF